MTKSSTASNGGVQSAAEQLAGAIRALPADTSEGTLTALCRIAVDLVDGAEYAAVETARGHEFATVAATDPVCEHVDRLQHTHASGPTMQALFDGGTVVCSYLAAEDRWPHFARDVVDTTPVRSMVSDALFAEDGTLGALTLCAEKPHAFGRQSIAVATALVAHAAVAYRVTRQQNTIDNLRIALATSRMIGTAIGILKARNDISADEAFDLLRWSSQRKHRKLRDIAEEVVETGRLP